MKINFGFLGLVLLGTTHGCSFSQSEFDCEFVNTCIAESNNSTFTNSVTTASTNDANSKIGYSARWLTNRLCDLNGGRACHWEIEQFPQYGDAFKNNGGQIVILTTGYYRIHVALYNQIHDHWIGCHLKKNDHTLAAG